MLEQSGALHLHVVVCNTKFVLVTHNYHSHTRTDKRKKDLYTYSNSTSADCLLTNNDNYFQR